jgi:hypothetical protein
MNEPAKENPKTSKRSRRRPAMEPLGWDEIVSQPGMGGYLSFLNGPIPLPHLQGPPAATAVDPGVALDPESPLAAERPLSPGIIQAASAATVPGVSIRPETFSGPEIYPDPDISSTPGVITNSLVASDPQVQPISEPGSIPEDPSNQLDINNLGFVRPNLGAAPARISTTTPGPATVPEVVSIPPVPGHRIRIRRCAATHDGHSLGEEVLYQALWKAAQAESAQTRTIVIGWRGMSQLCRMTPKNCKINTQRLIRKLALEVLSPYNTPESIGTTYRVYSDQAILQRRREAGLEWVVRSRGVEFVNPATGISILPICAHTYQSSHPLT